MIRFDGVSKIECGQYDLARSYAFRQMLRGRRPDELRTEEEIVLSDVTLEIARGETVSLLGPDGSGTLPFAHLACGLTVPSFGEVTIDGVARMVGTAPTGQTPYMTLREYLRLTGGLLSTDVDRIREVIAEAPTRCGLEGQEKTKLFNLPNLLLRRLTVHLCLSFDADIFVFPVPVRIKDPADEALFAERLEEIFAKRTVVWNARSPREIPANADRVLVIRGGRVFYDGDAETAVAVHEAIDRQLELEREELATADADLDDIGTDEAESDADPDMEESGGTALSRGADAKAAEARLIDALYRNVDVLLTDARTTKTRVAGDASFDPAAFVERELGHLASNDDPILVGPYLGDVGHEALYWAPLLRAASAQLGIDPKRWRPVSRGGAEVWYESLGEYVDGYDLYDADEFARRCQQRLDTSGLKQREPTGFEAEMFERAGERLGLERHHTVHVGVLTRAFQATRKSAADSERWLEYLRPHRPQPSATSGVELELPERYVAARFDFFPSLFPDTKLTRYLVRQIITALEADCPVVLAHTGQRLIDHFEEFDDGPDGVVQRSIRELATPRNQLSVASEVARGASGFVGTWGGVSLLAATHGVPALQLVEEPSGNLSMHLDATRQWFGETNTPYRVLPTAQAVPDDLAAWLREHAQ